MSTEPTTDLVLRWEFDSGDIRKLNIWTARPGDQDDLKLYYFLTFGQESTYYRFNLATDRYENAGSIEWLSTYNIRLNMGLRSLHVEALTRRNKPTSRSRRFKALNNVEYKWRPADDEPMNLECMTVTGRKFVALYTNANNSMRVHPRGQGILDDIVISCLIHLYRRSKGVDFVVPDSEPGPSTV